MAELIEIALEELAAAGHDAPEWDRFALLVDAEEEDTDDEDDASESSATRRSLKKKRRKKKCPPPGPPSPSESDAAAKGDLVELAAHGVGAWDGSCTCPESGLVHQVQNKTRRRSCLLLPSLPFFPSLAFSFRDLRPPNCSP